MRCDEVRPSARVPKASEVAHARRSRDIAFAPPCTQPLRAPRRTAATQPFESAARATPRTHDERRQLVGERDGEGASRPGATLQQAPGGLKMGEDMPLVCEVCLGPNPYIRMIKMPMSRECKISGRPYTAFRWQPGAEARYKETIIAPEVAIAKNVCQVCLMDMEYNLPVRVRDQLMGAGGERGGIQTPSSDTNKEYHWANQRKAMEEGTLQGFQELNAQGRQGMGQSFNKLASLSRGGSAAHSPYYDRNLPKMCSFWCGRRARASSTARARSGRATASSASRARLAPPRPAVGARAPAPRRRRRLGDARHVARDGESSASSSKTSSRARATRRSATGTTAPRATSSPRSTSSARRSSPSSRRPTTRGSARCGSAGSRRTSRSRTSTTPSTRTARWRRSSSSPSAAAPSSPTPSARRPRRRRARSTASSASRAATSSSGGPRPHRRRPRRPRGGGGRAAAAARRAGRRRRRASRRRRARGARAHYPSMNPSAMGARPDQ